MALQFSIRQTVSHSSSWLGFRIIRTRVVYGAFLEYFFIITGIVTGGFEE
jgi:hypothetical protein